MENTGKALFSGDTQPQWFISVGELSIGPMTSGEVYERIAKGEISWAHYVWKEGQGDWQRICDIATFQIALPPVPPTQPKAMPPQVPQGSVQLKEWFVFMNDTQYGPFSEDEVKGLLRTRRANDRSFVWKDGMKDWEKIGDLAFFQASIPAPIPIAPGSKISEKRAFERRPLIARVMIVEGDRVIVGIGRDISIGGMQVLSEYVPARKGSRLKLNVSPPDLNQPSFQPFTAEGVVVRIMDDQTGFSFRFENLSDPTRSMIERIVSQS